MDPFERCPSGQRLRGPEGGGGSLDLEYLSGSKRGDVFCDVREDRGELHDPFLFVWEAGRVGWGWTEAKSNNVLDDLVLRPAEMECRIYELRSCLCATLCSG